MNKFNWRHCRQINSFNIKQKPIYTYLINLILKASFQVLFFFGKRFGYFFFICCFIDHNPSPGMNTFAIVLSTDIFNCLKNLRNLSVEQLLQYENYYLQFGWYFHRRLLIMNALLKMNIYLQYYISCSITFPLVFSVAI